MVTALALWTAAAARGQRIALPCGADTLRLQFKLRESELDMGYAGNSLRLDAFVARLHELDAMHDQQLAIYVYTGASPEGPAELNRRLGERRGNALRYALTERLAQEGLECLRPRIIVVNEGARWEHLYQAVAQSREPWRERVMAIVRETPPPGGEWLLDPREEQLRRLDGGSIWQQLISSYLPPLRSVGTAVIARLRDGGSGRRDTLVIRDTVYYMPLPTAVQMGAATADAAAHRARRPATPIDTTGCWLLKTNTLMLGLTVPNVSVERSLGRRWSIELQGAWAWWTLSAGAYANQLMYGAVELRHWLGDRRRHSRLSGWHIGIGLGGGYYDLEWRSKGYQGEALNAYLSIGWQHRFGRRRRWVVDLAAGAGGLFTKYRYYRGSTLYPEGHTEPQDDHLMYQRHGRLNWIGPNFATISIGYRL